MPDELWERVQAVAKQRDVTAGQLVREAIEHEVGAETVEGEVAVAAMPNAVLVAKLTPKSTSALVAPPFRCPVCQRGYQSQIRCSCSNRLAVPA